MEIKVQKKIGTSVLDITIDEKDEREALAKATFYLQPDYCGLCKGTNIVWQSNKAKTDDGIFTYVKRICLSCKAVSTAGEYKTGGLFWKNWEVYQPKDASSGTAPQTMGVPPLTEPLPQDYHYPF